MRTHTGQHSRLPSMDTLNFAWLVVRSVQKSYRNWRRHGALGLYKGNFASSFRGVSFPNLRRILSNNFSMGTSTPGRLISERKFGESSPLMYVSVFPIPNIYFVHQRHNICSAYTMCRLPLQSVWSIFIFCAALRSESKWHAHGLCWHSRWHWWRPCACTLR